MATQNVEIRRRAKSPSDFILGGYLVAMDRVFNPLIPFFHNPIFHSGENLYNIPFLLCTVKMFFYLDSCKRYAVYL
jgi:hypothetical protein